jgi:dihydroorotase
LCSDDALFPDDAKPLPIAQAEPAATGVELLLPLALKWAAEARVPLPDALARITARPARILGVEAGTLGVGAPADVCVFDPAAAWTVGRTTLLSQGKNTPFAGFELEGRARWTLVGGNIVHGA